MKRRASGKYRAPTMPSLPPMIASVPKLPLWTF
jgi:hypothetical protein